MPGMGLYQNYWIFPTTAFAINPGDIVELRLIQKVYREFSCDVKPCSDEVTMTGNSQCLLDYVKRKYLGNSSTQGIHSRERHSFNLCIGF